MTLTTGSLCAGIEAFGLAFTRVGFDLAWSVEIDANCQDVNALHFPDAAQFGDIRGCGKHNLRPVDVITAGTPCTDLSVAGKREGLHGEQSKLFFEAIRIMGELQPSLVLFENVPGLFSSNDGRDFATVLRSFRELGARDIGWTVLDAQYFGVPQRRRRIFLVASFGNAGECAAEILFEPESMRWHPQTRRQTRTSVAGTLGGGSQKRGWCNDLDRATFDECGPVSVAQNQRGEQHGSNVGEMGTLRAGNGNVQSGVPFVAHPLLAATNDKHDDSLQTYIAHALTAEGFDASEDGTGRGVPLIAATLESGTNRTGGTRPPGTTVDTAESLIPVTPEIAAAQRCGNSRLQDANAIPQGYGVRRLLPVECERLQGMPDSWTERGASGKLMADSTRYRMLGNSAAIPVVEWIAERMLTALEAKAAA